MVVPIFSGIPNEPQLDLVKQGKHAATVGRHAVLFRHLIEPYLCGRYHISFIPPLVGYGAFVVGIVFIVMRISCPNSEINGLFPEEIKNGGTLNAVKSILHLLDHLRVYWRALQRLVSHTLVPRVCDIIFSQFTVGNLAHIGFCGAIRQRLSHLSTFLICRLKN